jgi:hypothetical protein
LHRSGPLWTGCRWNGDHLYRTVQFKSKPGARDGLPRDQDRKVSPLGEAGLVAQPLYSRVVPVKIHRKPDLCRNAKALKTATTGLNKCEEQCTPAMAKMKHALKSGEFRHHCLLLPCGCPAHSASFAPMTAPTLSVLLVRRSLKSPTCCNCGHVDFNFPSREPPDTLRREPKHF